MKHLDGLTDDQLLEFAQKRMPLYRRLMARTKSFLSGLFGMGSESATAADYKIDVNGDQGLKQGGQITLTNFKAPSFEKMREHVTALQESDAVDELTFIVDRLSKSENVKMQAEAKRMYAILDALTKTFNRSLEALENIADKHLPVEVARIFESADATVSEMMKAYTGDTNIEVPINVLVGCEDDRIDFVQYFDVTEFANDRMWIVVTCSLTAVGSEYVMSRHVTIQDRFQGPMSYDVGEAVVEKDMAKSVKSLLAIHGIVAMTGALPLKLDEKRITTALKRLDFVKDIKIAPKAINVWVKFNKKTFEQEKEIFAVLSSDADIRKLLGRSKRLYSQFTDDKHWQFSVVSRG